MTGRGRFITFEGIDGAGKSSHIAQAVQWLRQTSHDHVPALFQQSFLVRNPVNAAVLAAAQHSGTQ